jgi:predicted phage terminase large subunit-like protein
MKSELLLKMSEHDRVKALEILTVLDQRRTRKEAREKFLTFVNLVWEEYISGRHFEIMSDAFERMARGDLKRLIINMPPRHGKSEMSSYLLPAWWLGLNPNHKVMQFSHSSELAEGFGRKVRNLVDSDTYQSVFPDTKLSKDSTAAARWGTSRGGEYHALGLGTNAAGKGGNLCIIDDAVSEQIGKSNNPEAHKNVYDLYMTGARQRLQPGGCIVLVMTRWSALDLTGKLLDKMQRGEGGDEWELIEFPAIMPSGKPLWGEFWSIEELERTRAELDARYWNAQYMQRPTSEESAVIKREWWRTWTRNYPPAVDHVIMTWDTAYEKHNKADYSAMTVWGIFDYVDDEGVTQNNIILLDAQKQRVEFPELKQWVYDSYMEWKPDTMIVEKRASGASLIQELRRMGIPVGEFMPTRGNDKYSRLVAVADVFSSGFVWAPDTKWAEDLIEEVASFPAGANDDLTDCLSLAINRYRQGGLVRTTLDEPEEELYFRRKPTYY